MATQVTLTLPDEIYQNAERLARKNGRSVTDVLATTLRISLLQLNQQFSSAVETLDDAAVLALAEAHMDAEQSARLSQLLQKQQVMPLDEIDH